MNHCCLAALLAWMVSPSIAQEFHRIGVAPADTDTFTVDASVTVTSKGKTPGTLDYRTEFRIVYSAKTTETGATLQGRFARFSFVGRAGESALDIHWTQDQKIDAAAWGQAAALKQMVAEGFTIDLDRAGNPVLCGSAGARLLVMAVDPLLVGAGTWFDGGTRAIGDQWTSSFQNAEVLVSSANVYEKNEAGAAIIVSSFSLKDRRTQETVAGGGTSRTQVDGTSGRPRGCTIAIDLPSKDHPVHVEAGAKVTPGKP